MKLYDGKDMKHWTITGATGSGKTYLAKAYVVHSPVRVNLLDSKGDTEIPGWGKHVRYVYNIEQFESLVKVPYKKEDNNRYHIIYRPTPDEIDDKDIVNRFFRACYYDRPSHCFIDEVGSIATAGQFPSYYKAILERGRSIRVGAISLTQRPRRVPMFIFSESQFWNVFRLNKMDDRNVFYENSGQLIFKGGYYTDGKRNYYEDVDLYNVDMKKLKFVKVNIPEYHSLFYNNITGAPPIVVGVKKKIDKV